MYSILCDYDGTLIKDDGQIDTKYLPMLQDICNNNHLFLLSSSSYNELLNFKNKYSLKLNIFSLSSNICLIDGEMIVNKISKNIINTLIKMFNRHIYTAYSESENDVVIFRYQERLEAFYPKGNRIIETIIHDDRPSITFAIANEISESFYKKIQLLRLGYQILGKDKNRELVTIYQKHISKSDGYYYIKNKYPEDKIISISDSIFDYDMFIKSDIKIAMRNADLELKNRSQIITQYDNNDSGAIRALYNICHLK